MAMNEYKSGTAFTGVIGRTYDTSTPAWPQPLRSKAGAPTYCSSFWTMWASASLVVLAGHVKRPTSIAWQGTACCITTCTPPHV
jgi:hypothetical protein